MKVRLERLALARSGDKGDSSNVAVIARTPEIYHWLEQNLSAERVRQHFHAIARGQVERFLAPNLLAINFILHDSLGGTGSASLKTDAQGKTHGLALLLLEVDVPAALIPAEAGAE